MRPFPVDLAAVRANIEFVVIKFGLRLEPAEDFLLFNRHYNPVAFEASIEGFDKRVVTEPPEHLLHLYSGVVRPEPVAVRYYPESEEPSVAGEDDAALAPGKPRYFMVGVVVPVCRIEPEHPETHRKLTEIDVNDKQWTRLFPERYFFGNLQ